MLKDNLIMLRKLNSYSQEQIAEKINISRQAYAKWESGATVPDIDKAAALAQVYGVTLDSLRQLALAAPRRPDFISVGRLTHSAVSADFSMTPQPES